MKDKDKLIKDIEDRDLKQIVIPRDLPIIPIRDIIIYPFMIFPVLIGRTSSLKAVSAAVENEKFIFLTIQKNPDAEEPTIKDIHRNGTIAKVIQIMRLPNNMIKLLVEGVIQGRIVKSKRKKADYLTAEIEPLNYYLEDKSPESIATMRKANELFRKYVKENKHLPNDLLIAYDNLTDPARKLYFAAANIGAKIDVKQRILDSKSLTEQYFEMSRILAEELDLLKIEEEVESKVQNSIQKTQRKYYIQEQIRALQNELDEDDIITPELQALKDNLDKAGMPELAYNKAMEEFNKLKKLQSMSPDYPVIRNYLDLMVALPWANASQDNLNITHVKEILDEDHYDLEKPKERILEYIAILNLTGNLKRQILCFVGPPGVGKTSLGKSIARALGRKFIRIALGGVRDEAEIRGHRRTYIGALPGKIIHSMKKAGTVNPVILLDEIDKMATDFRGDPSAALLEVLDPEQNNTFNDHYLETDYDLSNVLFITTANVKYEIPSPLLDRMEIIELGSYLDYQKYEIATRHIIPKMKNEYGLQDLKIDFTEGAVYKLIREYTKEAGVRNLEREIGSVLRKLTKEIIIEADIKPIEGEEITALKDNKAYYSKLKRKKFPISEEIIERYLKAPRFKIKKEDLESKVGVATGLAWTSVGGDILPIEVNIMPGAEKLTLTGKLGEVMKESAMAALSLVRANYKEFDIDEKFYEKKEIHIHVPEGAIPKDGPSAGITMTAALISAAANKPLRGDLAMTGEITLRGKVLAIGGLSEKLLAARRAGIMNVLIPYENKRDVEDIAVEIKQDMNIVPVKNIMEALGHLFVK